MIPELREIAEHNMTSSDSKKAEGAQKLTAAIDELLARPEHSWYTGNLPAAEAEKRKKAQEDFKARYGKE